MAIFTMSGLHPAGSLLYRVLAGSLKGLQYLLISYLSKFLFGDDIRHVCILAEAVPSFPQKLDVGSSRVRGCLCDVAIGVTI